MAGPIVRPPFVKFEVPTHGSRRPKHFVFHTTEGSGTIESLAAYFRGTPDQLGVNYIIEPNGRMGSIGNFFALTYHVGPENNICIGGEQIGYHTLTRVQWFMRLRQLWAAAWLAAWVSQELDIPLMLSAKDRQWIAESGFCEHKDVPNNDHIDCGPGYPLGWVLATAAKWRDSGVPLFVRLAIPKP